MTFDAGLLDPATGSAAVAGDRALLDAMIDVEAAHLASLVAAGVATGSVEWDRSDIDLAAISSAGAAGGNPVIPLVAALRRRTPAPLADAVHLGLTSQDVLDSGLMLLARRSLTAAAPSLDRVLATLAELADRHRGVPVAGRTLGQQAAPTTAGLRFAVLLAGVDRTRRHLDAQELPLQLGGSVGTLAVLVDRLGADGAARVRSDVAARLGLDDRIGVWHVERSTVSLLGAALAALIGSLGRIGLEIAQGARTEIGELDLELGDDEGGSSAMPQKRNPVAAVLLVANARRAPGLAATLLASQLAMDDRPAGEWHAEWQPLRELLRLAVESAELAAGAVGSLSVHDDRMRANLGRSRGAIHAERAQQVLAAAIGRPGASAMVREALASDDFVSAVRDAAAPVVDATVAERLTAVTSTGGAVGLSDRLIDDAIRAARGGTR